MGGDYSPRIRIRGAIEANKELSSDIELVLIGDEKIIKKIFQQEQEDISQFKIIHASETIGMSEHPAKSFVKKQKSGIAIGYKMLSSNEIDGFASAGNTGAMLVGAMYTVKVISNVIRPAISTVMPKDNGKLAILLDIGINPDVKPDILYQYAIIGSVYAENIFGIKNPRVGLLNIGSEEEKGNLLTKATYGIMKDTNDFNFIGNVEGTDFFNDEKEVDVIVCDGFTGNIVLKGAEAFYSLIKKKKVKNKFFDIFNPEIYGGTPILGINSNVIIGHGASSIFAIKNMIIKTKTVIEANLSEKIKTAFKQKI